MIKNNKIYPIIIIIATIFTYLFLPVPPKNSFYAAQEEGLDKQSININGVTRTYWVYTPKGYKTTSKALPLVLVFHGSIADGKKIMNYTKFNDAADKYKFIAAYPEKIDMIDWDLKSIKNNKEAVFVDRLIDQLEKTYNINKSKVYAAGFSSGADLCLFLSGKLNNKIAAFAAISGNMRKRFIPEVTSTTPVSILMVNGTEDPYDKWNGDNEDQMSVEDSIKFWEKHNGYNKIKTKLTQFPHKTTNTSTTAFLYINKNEKMNSEVSLLKIENGGHTWPGSPTDAKTRTFLGRTNYDILANDIIWKFFDRHELNEK